MKSTKDNILLIGIGNNGRSDDGLGWAFAEDVESGISELDVVYRYQLQIEDAELISQYRTVIFVDSTVEYFPEGYEWKSLKSAVMSNFTSHALEPCVILGLCEMIYNHTPTAYQLAITGETWDLCQDLSKVGKQHLGASKKYAVPIIASLATSYKLI